MSWYLNYICVNDEGEGLKYEGDSYSTARLVLKDTVDFEAPHAYREAHAVMLF